MGGEARAHMAEPNRPQIIGVVGSTYGIYNIQTDGKLELMLTKVKAPSKPNVGSTDGNQSNEAKWPRNPKLNLVKIRDSNQS